MKICFISNCSRIGGAERVLLETIDVMTESGIECCVLLPGEGKFADELSRRRIQYATIRSCSLTMSGKPTPWQRFKAIPRFAIAAVLAARIIVKWNCDLIYSNTVTVGHGAIVAWLLQKPHIWHLHEFGKEDHGFNFYFGERFSIKTIGSMSSICIVVSNALAMKYQQFIARPNLTVIYPSMHLELDGLTSRQESTLKLAPRKARFQCIVVGGIFAGKRQEDALRALSVLRTEGLDVHLLIVGGVEDTLYREALDEIICENELEDFVCFTGEVRDARPMIQQCDALLVFSRSEAFGRVTIEAMLAGKPVIGAAAGATPELVIDGLYGLIYKLGDTDALAETIKYLHNNPDTAHYFGKNGQQWAHSIFTKERYSSELLVIINSVRKPVVSQIHGPLC